MFQDHIAGRDHFLKNVLDGGKKENACVVSLGDLGESKSVDETKELFAGTSRCLQLARDYLEGYKVSPTPASVCHALPHVPLTPFPILPVQVPFEVVGGNHDLEGIDEYPTDKENLEARHVTSRRLPSHDRCHCTRHANQPKR